MITDWMLALLCAVLAFRLYSFLSRTHARRAVAVALALGAIAAGVGGLRHGLGPWIFPVARSISWFVSYALIAVSSTFLLWGVLRAVVRFPEQRAVYRICCWFKCGIAILFLLLNQDPAWVARHWATDVFIIGCIAWASCEHWSTRAMGRWLATGVGISIVAGVIQCGWPFGSSGTLHNDLFHLLEMPAAYCYYRATLLFREPSDPAKVARPKRWTKVSERPRGGDDAA